MSDLELRPYYLKTNYELGFKMSIAFTEED